MTLGSNPPGSIFYALASGLAKVVSGATPIQVVVQPHTGTTAFLPLVNSGEMEWTRERAVDPDATLPYHAGAVRLYMERGVWSAKMDEAQRKLLSLNP